MCPSMEDVIIEMEEVEVPEHLKIIKKTAEISDKIVIRPVYFDFDSYAALS